MAGKEDYSKAIEALKLRRNALDIAIAELEALNTDNVNQDHVPALLEANNLKEPTALYTTEIKPDEFWGLSITEAAKKYLNMVKRPRNAKDIARALKAGGNLSTSPHFLTIVRSALKRDSDFEKVKREWGLAEWYPSRPKRLEPIEKSKGKKKSKPQQKPKEPQSEN